MCVLSVLDFLIAFIREWLSDFGQARPGSDVNLNQYQCVCVWWVVAETFASSWYFRTRFAHKRTTRR